MLAGNQRLGIVKIRLIGDEPLIERMSVLCLEAFDWGGSIRWLLHYRRRIVSGCCEFRHIFILNGERDEVERFGRINAVPQRLAGAI